MTTQWYCAANGQKLGPLSWSELRALFSQGYLKSSDMVLQDGTKTWLAAAEIDGLVAATAPDTAGPVAVALPETPADNAAGAVDRIALQVQAGVWWTVRDGYYYASPAVGTDAVTTLAGDALASDQAVEVTVNTSSPGPGYRSNAFVIFDYRGPTDFKYAGARTEALEWVIGERTARGWTDQTRLAEALAAGSDCRIQVRLQGQQALLSFNGQLKLAYEFPEPVTTGRLGLATENSVARFDDLVVRTIPATANAAVRARQGG